MHAVTAAACCGGRDRWLLHPPVSEDHIAGAVDAKRWHAWAVILPSCHVWRCWLACSLVCFNRSCLVHSPILNLVTFAGLVTQLKWRLLEGGGQAYYELGVADSGQLVGLSRRDLDVTLSTLEDMCGEIGASVIIVKEIEVPALRTVRKGILGDTNGGVDFSKVDGAMRLPRRRHLLLSPSDDSERDTDTPETDPTTDEDNGVSVLQHDQWSDQRESSPEDDEELTFDIEVSAVYKPLPSLRKARAPLQATLGKSKGAAKKARSAAKQLPKAVDLEARALERKARREARREERKRAVNALDRNGESAIFDMEELDDALHASVATITSAESSAAATASGSTAREYDPQYDPSVPKGIWSCPDDESGLRYIVEALVVRKPAHDEAFSTLDDFSFLIG